MTVGGRLAFDGRPLVRFGATASGLSFDHPGSPSEDCSATLSCCAPSAAMGATAQMGQRTVAHGAKTEKRPRKRGRSIPRSSSAYQEGLNN